MELKLIEIRDKATLIAAFAFRPSDAIIFDPRDHLLVSRTVEQFLAHRSGYYTCGLSSAVVLGRLGCEGRTRLACDPYDWNDRTMTVAHDELIRNWDKYPSGSVLDVEFVLGESSSPKTSEAYL